MWRQPTSWNQRLRDILFCGTTGWAFAGSSASTSPGAMIWAMSVHILEDLGGAELNGRDDTGDDEQDDRDG